MGTLSLDGNVDATAETTTFSVAGQSTVGNGSSLNVGSLDSASIDTVNIVLDEALTVHGWITLRTGATVNSGGNGKILISETGQGAIWDSVELNLDVEIEAGGGLSLSAWRPTSHYVVQAKSSALARLRRGSITALPLGWTSLTMVIWNFGLTTRQVAPLRWSPVARPQL